MARRAPIAIVAAIAALVLSHCAQQRQGPPSSNTSPAQSVLPLVPTPNVVPSASAALPAPSASTSVVAVAPTFVMNTIQCGKKLCNLTTETCCIYSDEGDCRKREPIRGGKLLEERLSAQLEVCNKTPPSDLSLSEVLYCDDSSDCPANQACCAQWMWSGASFNSCVPLRPDGKNACELVEACVIRGNCRTPNTVCQSGKCVLKDARIRCAGTVCDGSTPACCRLSQDAPPKCVAEKDCIAPQNSENGPFPVRQECSGPSSCARGMYCQSGLLGTYCSGMRDGANAALVCDTVRDCSQADCKAMGQKGPVKCEPDQASGFSTCSCQ